MLLELARVGNGKVRTDWDASDGVYRYGEAVVWVTFIVKKEGRDGRRVHFGSQSEETTVMGKAWW